MKNGRIQAKDIPDAALLAALEPGGQWTMLWDLAERLDAPWQVVRAKADRMKKRGTLHGCTCGCRGDFHPPDGCSLGY